MVTADGKKTGGRCGETKPAVGNFYRVRRAGGDGFHGYCIPCVKAAAVAWQKANPEKKRAQDRKRWLKKPKKGHFRKYATEAERKAALREQKRHHNQKPESKEQHRNRQHLYRLTLEYSAGHSVSGALTLSEWRSVLLAFGERCVYCGVGGRLAMEHLTPTSKGGAHALGNVAPACKSCNSRKKDKTLEDFVGAPRAEEIREKALLH